VDSKKSEVQGPRDGVGQSQAGSTAQCGTALYSTVQCSAMQGTVQYRSRGEYKNEGVGRGGGGMV
jgi:hypothetical protein